MEYYGVKYTVKGIPLLLILEGIDTTMAIAPLVWTIGSMNMNDLTMCKYIKRYQAIVNNSDTHKIVRIRPCIVVEGTKMLKHRLISLDVLLAEYGLTSDKIMLVKHKITSISDNDSVTEHNPAAVGNWFPESMVWTSLLE